MLNDDFTQKNTKEQFQKWPICMKTCLSTEKTNIYNLFIE